MNEFEEIITNAVGQAERLEVKVHRGAIEHAKNYAFPKLGW